MTAESTPSNLYPCIYYDDPNAAIAFLCRAFGFRERLVVRDPDGQVRHSELTFGPGVIMVGPAKSERGTASPLTLGRTHSGLCVQIDDPDAHYARAKAAGAEITQELKNEDYGSRGYMAKDIGGHIWYFGTYRPGEHWTT